MHGLVNYEMSSKLTLTIDKNTIEKAKAYAKSNNRSLSDLVEHYFKALVNEKVISEDISPLVKSLRGAFNSFV